MKSLFKRVLASATGTVLVLSQLAAVNINAADTASDLVLDRAWLTDVPVDELPTVDELPVVIEGEAAEVESLTWGESIWNSKFETAVLSITGDASVTKTTVATKIKDAIKRRLKDTSYFTEEQAARAVDLISDADVTLNSNGTAQVVVNLSEASALFGEIAEQEWEKDGFNANGEVDVDWSGFSITGTAIIDVDFRDYDKTATYNVTINDGTKTYDGLTAFAEYATSKFLEAEQYVIAQAKAQGSASDRLEEQAAKYAKRLQDALNAAKRLGAAVNAISLTGTDLDQTYADYLAAVDAAIDAANVSDRVANKARTELEKAPETFTGAITSGRAAKWIDTAVEAAQKFAADKATINLSSADVAAIIDEGYDYNIVIPNGYSFDLEFSLADDQNAELADAIVAAYGDQWAADGYEFVEVISHKEVTADADTSFAVDGDKLYYNVVRVIDEVILRKVEETTTSETTTTETTTSETTTSETTTSETTSSETTTSETTTSETTTSETTTTESTDVTETTTSTEDTNDVTETTTSSQLVIGDYKYELEFVGDAGVTELVYWSEETTPFDLTNLSVSMKLTKTNINDPADVTVTNSDVTADFAPVQQSPQDFDFQGFGYYALQIALKDADALQATLTEKTSADVTAALVEHYSIANGETMATFNKQSFITVVLVLRGDATLDNVIDAKDANTVLSLFNMISILDVDLEYILNSDYNLFTGGNSFNLLKYGHYAGDCLDAIGKLDAKDANAILNHFNIEVILGMDPEDYEWSNERLIGHDVTPLSELHAEPLVNSDLDLG